MILLDTVLDKTINTNMFIPAIIIFLIFAIINSIEIYKKHLDDSS